MIGSSQASPALSTQTSSLLDVRRRSHNYLPTQETVRISGFLFAFSVVVLLDQFTRRASIHIRTKLSGPACRSPFLFTSLFSFFSCAPVLRIISSIMNWLKSTYGTMFCFLTLMYSR